MNAGFWPGLNVDDASADQREERYSVEPIFLECDVVLVEGDTQTTFPKIEVWRPETAQLPLAHENATIHAVVSDTPVGVPVGVWPRSDIRLIAEKLLALIQRQL